MHYNLPYNIIIFNVSYLNDKKNCVYSIPRGISPHQKCSIFVRTMDMFFKFSITFQRPGTFYEAVRITIYLIELKCTIVDEKVKL